MSKLYFYKCAHFLLFLSHIPTTYSLHSHPFSLHSHPDSPHSHPDFPHSHHDFPIPIIPPIPRISTLIPRIPTLIPSISIISLIPFPDSPIPTFTNNRNYDDDNTLYEFGYAF